MSKTIKFYQIPVHSFFYADAACEQLYRKVNDRECMMVETLTTRRHLRDMSKPFITLNPLANVYHVRQDGKVVIRNKARA